MYVWVRQERFSYVREIALHLHGIISQRKRGSEELLNFYVFEVDKQGAQEIRKMNMEK